MGCYGMWNMQQSSLCVIQVSVQNIMDSQTSKINVFSYNLASI